MKHFIVGLIASLSLTIATAAIASPPHHRHHGYHRHYHPHQGWVWVAPTIIGGVIGYEIARSQQPVIVQQTQPVIIPQSPQINCSQWKEIRHEDGRITQERICYQQ